MNLHKMIEDVRLFHQTFGHPIQPKPAIPSPERQVLRNKLIRDEYIGEFDPAWAECAALKKLEDQGKPIDPAEALAEFGDVIADLIYYLIGAALEYGIPLDKIWDAVQEANMSKLWTWEEVSKSPGPYQGWKAIPKTVPTGPGKTEEKFIVYDETGKVRKPPSWKEPNIVAIIKGAMNGSQNPS